MRRHFFYILAVVAALIGCSENDSFTTSRGALLTFSSDTVKMDTVFTGIGSSTYSFWVYNHSGDGIRLNSVRLRNGNQTGFRVNIDGSFLDNSMGSSVNDLEIRKDDSLRVFVELTAPERHQLDPQLVEDHLVFVLESGVEQNVCLRAWAWDAMKLHDVVIHNDSLIESACPIVVYGGISVDSAATLTIRNTTVYFHDGRGIDVYGRLLTDSAIFRGDRLDHMFDYLPYDRVSGQWGKSGGIVFHASSSGNVLRRTEIRNAGLYGVLCDSAACDTTTLRLDMYRCVVHNCDGDGLVSRHSNIRLRQCQFTNAAGDCVSINGGRVELSRCTLAQFYPFQTGGRAALRFTNVMPLYALNCDSSIITGYADDVWMCIINDTVTSMAYAFSNSLLRTPQIADTLRFRNILWETPKDSIQGKMHFINIDEKNFYYDFHLDSLSTAKGWGCY